MVGRGLPPRVVSDVQMRDSSAVLGSWEEILNEVGTRSGMWVGRPRYALVRSFVEGFGAAQDDDVLDGFQRWLSSQPQHHAIQNYSWSTLLLHELFPDRDRPTAVAWNVDDPANAGWPLPPDTPTGEDDLSYPHDDALAIAHLFRRLKEYLDTID